MRNVGLNAKLLRTSFFFSYNLRVVECRLAALLLSRALGIEQKKVLGDLVEEAR
jgi:hypothetical protein